MVAGAAVLGRTNFLLSFGRLAREVNGERKIFERSAARHLFGCGFFY